MAAFIMSCVNRQNKDNTTTTSHQTSFGEVFQKKATNLPPSDYQSLTQVYSQKMRANRDTKYRDERLLTMRETRTPYHIPAYSSKEQWEKRKKKLREQILISAGLWPMPLKNSLHPIYYHQIDHGDYIVETVTIQPYPGFYLAGNVYRPKGKGPFPGILSPHGHFDYGRLNDTKINSIPARAINFARQGYVVFTYDMVGYNDTRQVTHNNFAKNDSISTLYGINLLGLQLRNSLRAMDFLEGLPMVDKNKIGITGASGGATQTFLLTAVDDRFQVSAPVNMISHIFQGGGLCENAPGLRINTNNVEIAAMVAPKPLLMVSNTHDWTHNTRSAEYPMIQSIYDLYDARQKVTYAYFDYKHNYNKASREAVYPWFGKWLLDDNKAETFHEEPYEVDSDENLLAFMTRKTSGRKKTFKQYSKEAYRIDPDTMLDEEGLKSQLKEMFAQQNKDYWPTDKKSLSKFRDIYGKAMKHLAGATQPDSVRVKIMGQSKGEGFIASQLLIARKGKLDWIPCILYQPLKPAESTTILTADSGKAAEVSKEQSKPAGIIKELLKNRQNVLVPDLFTQGEHTLQTGTETRRDSQAKYFTTFNLTDTQNQIQDFLTLIWFTKQASLSQTTNLYASGQSGITGLVLASITDDLERIVLDGNHFDPTSDQNMLKLDIPGIMRIGGLKTVAALASNQNLTLYNVHESLLAPGIDAIAQFQENADHFQITKKPVNQADIINILSP